MFNKGKKQLRKAAPVIALALIPMLTMAAGFQINENSPRLQGQAMAGSASDAGDVTAIFNNPAILATLKHDQVYVGGSYIAPKIGMSQAQSVNNTYINGPWPFYVPTDVEGSSQQNNVAPPAAVPVAYGAFRLGPALTAGIAITAPWGLTTDYNADSVVRYMALKTALKTINITPEIGYALNQHWKFGVGLQAQYAEAEFSEFDGSAASPATSPTDLKGNSTGYGYNLGVIYSPNDATDFGVSYRSEIDYDLKGHGQQYVQPGPIQPSPFGPGAFNSFNSNTAVSAEMNTPAALNLSATQKINQHWTVSSTMQVTFWSSLQNITIKMPDAYVKNTSINLHWQNSWLYALGTQYTMNKHWEFRAGVASDNTPTNDQYRDARIPDSQRYWMSAGSTYTINNNFSIDAAYEHIFMKDQSIDAQKQAGYIQGVPQETDTVQANYAGSANIFALGMNWKF